MAKTVRRKNTYFERIEEFLSGLLIVAFMILFIVNNGRRYRKRPRIEM